MRLILLFLRYFANALNRQEKNIPFRGKQLILLAMLNINLIMRYVLPRQHAWPCLLILKLQPRSRDHLPQMI